MISCDYGGSAWESNSSETVLAPHTGFEDITQGDLPSWCYWLMVVIVSKWNLKAQYHLAVLCFFCLGHYTLTIPGRGETGISPLSHFKESLTARHTRG